VETETLSVEYVLLPNESPKSPNNG
jgi:hypothetical protein